MVYNAPEAIKKESARFLPVGLLPGLALDVITYRHQEPEGLGSLWENDFSVLADISAVNYTICIAVDCCEYGSLSHYNTSFPRQAAGIESQSDGAPR